MKIVIFSNGRVKDYAYIRNLIGNFDYIICADGGVRHCNEMGLIPNFIIGDMDSAPREILDGYKEAGARIKIVPTEKDDTDTQLAVDKAIEMQPKEIILVGALGDRWDHSYANIMLLYRILKSGIRGHLLDDKNIITLSNTILHLKGQKGQVLSLLPFGGDVHILNSSGLKYPLNKKTLYTDYPLGMSNVFIDENVIIEIDKGVVLAIMAQD
ncbi:MAG: thiamine diphosphokinase [Clostridiales bacterium]|nr:thiamine diphosphokinase [Clostridiales bacterium]